MDKLRYQPFEKGQEKLVSEMVWEVFLEFEAPDYSDAGIETFKAFIAPEKLAHEIESNGYKIYCCYEGDTLAGVIALRNITHISLLFVRSSHHKRGIAKQLLKLAAEEITEKYSGVNELTVNSSPYAVEIYKRLGFVPADDMQERDGLIFMPMKKSLGDIENQQ